MTETPGNAESAAAPSLDELARRLLDLWQDQLTAAAANPDVASQSARLMAALPLPGMWLSQMGQMGAPNWGAMSPGSVPPHGASADIARAWSELARNWMQPGHTEGASDGSQQPGNAQDAPSAPAGAAPTAAASEPGSLDMDELRARLAGLEKRLATLGAKPKPKRKAKSKSATKRKPGATGESDGRAGAGNPASRSGPTDDGATG